MRILFLTTQLPYPPKSGGLIKSWNLLEHWSDKYEVDLIHPLKPVDNEHLAAFKEKGLVNRHFHTPVDVPRSLPNLLKSYLGHASLNVMRNYHPEIKSKVEDWVKEADILFIDHYELGQYIPRACITKVVLHEHNAEYVMWERLAAIESNPFKKLALKLEAKRIAKAERDYAGQAHQIWAAPNDIDELEKIGVDRGKMRKTYHLGEDFMLNQPDIEFDQTNKSILYIGTLTWEANVDGLLWFIENCWNLIQQQEEEVNLTIVGKSPDERILKVVKNKTGIQLTGFVEDLESCYRNHRVFIVPLRFGSGIKVKVLNALYRGIPLVTTAIGTEGLEAEHGKHLFEVKDAEEFSQSVCRLLNDAQTWKDMRDQARGIAKRYTWAQLLDDHDADLNELLD